MLNTNDPMSFIRSDAKKRRTAPRQSETIIANVPAEIWSRICTGVDARGLAALSLTARLFRRAINVPACLVAQKQWKILMAFYPSYDPFHQRLLDTVYRTSPAEFVDLLRLAFRRERFDFLRHLLVFHGHSFDPSFLDNKLIRWAARSGQLEIVNLLLKDGRVDPSTRRDADGKYDGPLRKAAKFGRLCIVERLLEDARVDPSVGECHAVRALFDHAEEIDPELDANPDLLLTILDRFLQDPRIDPSADDNALIVASMKSISGDSRYALHLMQDPRVDPRRATKRSWLLRPIVGVRGMGMMMVI